MSKVSENNPPVNFGRQHIDQSSGKKTHVLDAFPEKEENQSCYLIEVLQL